MCRWPPYTARHRVAPIATADDNSVAPPHSDATVGGDGATRCLLWGRCPADASRWHSNVGSDRLRRVWRLVSGY
jgi:hypothetical protein